jgi:iron complex transport system substrate-binding protein
MTISALSINSSSLFAQRLGLKPDQKIITIGSSISEIVCAMGLEGQIIGVDSNSNYPASLKSLPQLGYFRNLSIEGLLSLKPDLVLVSQDSGPPEVIQQIKKAGIRLYVISSQWGIFGLKQNIFLLGDILERQRPASELNDQVSKDWREQILKVNQWRKEYDRKWGKPLKVLFLMAHVPGRLMVAGQQTAANAILQMMGVQNPIPFSGYKSLSAESALMANPHVILTTTQGLQTLGGTDRLWKLPELSHSIAAKNQQVIAMDASYLLGFGPRLPHLMNELLLSFEKMIPQSIPMRHL